MKYINSCAVFTRSPKLTLFYWSPSVPPKATRKSLVSDVFSRYRKSPVA